ncbi:MAG TPA: hypothetical protein VJ553_02210 [Candidatus Paceibacterota bacterium]|nr:hypothetical protein [Candidatus Paceibacterota bacterium]
MFDFLGRTDCPLCHGKYPASYDCARLRHLDVSGGKIKVIKPSGLGGTDNIAHGWHWTHVTSIREAQVAVRLIFPQFTLSSVSATKLLIGESKIYRGSTFVGCEPTDFKYFFSWPITPQMYLVVYDTTKYVETTRYTKPWYDGEGGVYGNVFYDVLIRRVEDEKN